MFSILRFEHSILTFRHASSSPLNMYSFLLRFGCRRFSPNLRVSFKRILSTCHQLTFFLSDFNYVEKGLWYVTMLSFNSNLYLSFDSRALIMAQTTLNIYASDQIFKCVWTAGPNTVLTNVSVL